MDRIGKLRGEEAKKIEFKGLETNNIGKSR